MRTAVMLSALGLFVCGAACGRKETTPPAAQHRMEADISVRSTNPGSTCALSGKLHVPRHDAQLVNGDKWHGTAEGLLAGDLVVLQASIIGTSTWACEAECTLKTSGSTDHATAKIPRVEKEPPATCPTSRDVAVTCILSAPR